MMIWEDENNTREKLLELRRTNVCAVCGGMLNIFLDQDSGKAFLACNDWNRTHHQGIKREASRYEKEGLGAFNIPTRREVMENEHGEEKTKALARYIGTGVITRAIATEIVETLWGEAPLIEKTKAIIFCQTYQLNPLMRHIYLIGYKRRDRNGNYVVDKQGNFVLDWSMQIGIGATRLLAQRKHNYSYLDMTPRKATQEEIDKILGDTADPDSIYGFAHIKDIATGAEAFGLRGIPKNERIKGEEKGNTHLNMACIRAERLALDRQYPGEMPQGVEVIDERYAPSISSEGVEKIGGAAEGEGEEETGTTVFSTTKLESKKIETPAAEPEGFNIDMEWLKDTLKELKWTEGTAKSFVVNKYKVDGRGTLTEVLGRLTREQAEDFVKIIQEKVAQKQGELFP